MDKIKLSIIYVYYNTPEEILKSVLSLKNALNTINHEVIIVDNASVEKLPHDLQEIQNIKIVRNDKNLGYGKGLNQGARIAKGEYLLLINPDVEFNNDSIKLLLDRIKKDPKIGIIGPQMISSQGNVLQSISGMPFLPQSLFVFSFMGKLWKTNPFSVKYHNLNLDRNKEHYVDVVGGACMLIKKSVFDKVKGFDERFFMYFEEADLCFRIKKLGYKILYCPISKVIHLIGKSSNNKILIEKRFEKSRFAFFKKYHGFMPALLGEFFLRISKPINLLLLFILFMSLFLNFYKLEHRMIFIGDQGWFYLSALNILINKDFPLVGITSSHTWLHQGPFWTYILAVIMKFFSLNPLASGYFTALLSTVTTFFVYKLGLSLFSRKVGIISALLYATSPLVAVNAQMPYHTSPIPLLTIGLIYVTYKWIKGETVFFPFIFFLLALLYNFELATQVFLFPISLLFVYGLIRKKKWARNVLKTKILFSSFIFFILPMLPIIIYDLNHKLTQTVKFIIWIPYRVFTQIFNFSDKRLLSDLDNSFFDMIKFLFNSYKQLVFISNDFIALLLLILSFGSITYFFVKNKKQFSTGIKILILFILIPLIGIVVNMTPSQAYLPLFFPSVIILTAWIFGKLINKKYLFLPVLLTLFFIAILNFSFILGDIKNKIFWGPDYSQRLNAVRTILNQTKEKDYYIVGRGSGSNFESFTMNYEYIAWWLGFPPQKDSAQNVFIISEEIDNIKVFKEEINK